MLAVSRVCGVPANSDPANLRLAARVSATEPACWQCPECAVCLLTVTLPTSGPAGELRECQVPLFSYHNTHSGREIPCIYNYVQLYSAVYIHIQYRPLEYVHVFVGYH